MAQRLFFNMSNLLSQFFLHFQVTLTGNHDALCLRAAGTVHGFCPVTDGCRAQAEVFNEAQDFQAVFRRYGRYAFEVFIDIGPDFRIPQVDFRRCRHNQAAGDIFGQADNFIGEPGDVLLAHVGQQQVDEVVARFRRFAQGRAGNAATEEGFRCCISMILSLMCDALAQPL